MAINIIFCDKCGKGFRLDATALHERVIDEAAQVSKQYLVCPHCESEYTFFIKDPEIERMIHVKKPDTRKIKAYEDRLLERYAPQFKRKGNKK